MTPHLPRPVLTTPKAGLITALLACTALPIYAQSEFQGASLGGQVSFMNASTDLTIPDDDGNYHYEFGAASQSINLQAAYSLAFGKQTVLSIGASYRPGPTPAGSGPIGENIPMELELRNMWTAYVEPGYAIHPNTLIYGKFAYSSTKAVLAINGDDGPQELSTTLNGYGFGAGLRYLLTPSLYFQIEFLQLGYPGKDLKVPDDDDVRVPIKAGATTANIGLGLQF